MKKDLIKNIIFLDCFFSLIYSTQEIIRIVLRKLFNLMTLSTPGHVCCQYQKSQVIFKNVLLLLGHSF